MTIRVPVHVSLESICLRLELLFHRVHMPSILGDSGKQF